ncbi:MAG: cytochrome P450 [Pseudomonadota bacterium]|nr:cytochrome P450 [Pseudomonadota bacterium]
MNSEGVASATVPAAIPDHVPHGLVEVDFPLVMGRYTDTNPWHEIVPSACEGPDATYALGIVPGGRGGAWLFRRNEDLRHIFFDLEHFSSKGYSNVAGFIGESWNQVPTEIDPPEHGKYRVALNPLFSPVKMKSLEESLRFRARSLIERIKHKGGCELMSDFAYPFPVAVVLDMMGLPQERIWEFQKWAQGVLHSGDFSVMRDSVRSSVDYLRAVIAQRRQEPGDDVVSAVMTSQVDGRRWSDDELLGYAFNLFIGGLDTVTANIGNHIRHLAENPQHQQFLREQPERIPEALEEFMRAFAAVTTFRTCIKQTSVAGVDIRPGDRVAMCTTVASRDRQSFDHPHDVRLDRKPSHTSFGLGPHLCLGIHLARREMRIAYEELLAALPPFSINPGEPIRSQMGGIIQPFRLPLTWTTA